MLQYSVLCFVSEHWVNEYTLQYF